MIILMEAHPLWVAAFRVWVVNCVSIERGLDTRRHGCVNAFLSAVDCGCNGSSYPVTPLC